MLLYTLIIIIILYIIINYLIATLAFNPPSLTYTVKDIDYLYDNIAIKIIKKNSDNVILFNHNNADDIGICKNYCNWLSKFTDCSVILYDYIGYGLSYNGTLNEYNLLVISFYLHDALSIGSCRWKLEYQINCRF